MNNRLNNAVGLAMKAGRLKSGDSTVEKLVRAEQTKLVLLDAGASENTREKYRAMCQNHGAELIPVAELGRWIGKPGRMIAAVTDENFRNMIKRAFAEEFDADCEKRGGKDIHGKE